MKLTERTWFRYTVAVLAPIVATGVRVPMEPILGAKAPFLLFFPTLMAVGWLGGAWPAIVATLVSVLAVHAWILPPEIGWDFGNSVEMARTGLFAISAIIISALCGALHRARARIEAHARELEQAVEQRTLHLRQANRDLETFSYSVSHDLRAPLRALKSYAQILETEGATLSEAERADFARRIGASAERMDRLTVDLLAYARLSAIEMELGTIDVAPLIADVATRFGRKEWITVETGPELRVRANPVPFEQALTNLLDNAVRFVADGRTPQVRVRAARLGDMVRVTVEDNGIGIAPRHHQRIFEIFERLDAARFGGTGIGLALVKRAVERMQGRVGVESEVGAGSRFWFELPAA